MLQSPLETNGYFKGGMLSWREKTNLTTLLTETASLIATISGINNAKCYVVLPVWRSRITPHLPNQLLRCQDAKILWGKDLIEKQNLIQRGYKLLLSKIFNLCFKQLVHSALESPNLISNILTKISPIYLNWAQNHMLSCFPSSIKILFICWWS